MRPFLLAILSLAFSGCPNEDPCERFCAVVVQETQTWGVEMAVAVQPGMTASSAEVEVQITRPRYDYGLYGIAPESHHTPKDPPSIVNSEVKEGEKPYDEEIELMLHWSCPTLEKTGTVKVTVAEESATGKVKIDNLPPQPHLAVYPWDFRRGIECILMTADEKLAQEEATENREQSTDHDEDITETEETEHVYRGTRAFFIKKSAPEVKLSKVAVVHGKPDSYADIKVELLRNGVAVVAGDRSFDLEVEVKLPWVCAGITPPLKSGDTHIVISAAASSGVARLIMPPMQAQKLTCTVDANAYIDSYVIGNNAKTLEIDIPAAG